MEPLKITAFLASPFAVFDDYSPAFDGLLEYLLLEQLNLLAPNPTLEQVKATQKIVQDHLPLLKAEINGEWYWATSSPCYQILNEQIERYRKRWNPGIDSPEPNWKKRKAKWSTSEGVEKNYDIPLYLRTASAITWFAIGDKSKIKSLLSSCKGIGKKRSYGYGQITTWEVESISVDCHLWKNGQLMRPIPLNSLPLDRVVDCHIQKWGWRPPAWLNENNIQCALPIHNVKHL